MMKFKEDPWLTDYINAIHFSIRVIERQTRDRQALRKLKSETDALIQEALLGNLPMEIYAIRRLAARIEKAEQNLLSPVLTRRHQKEPPIRLKSYPRDARMLIKDFRFLCQGFEAITMKGITEECDLYFSKTYPDIPDMAATVEELIDLDVALGRLVQDSNGVYRHGTGGE